MVTVQEVLSELEAAGTEQNRRIYRRHGVQGDLYGVSYAHLNALKKKLKINHPLALELWASRNHDARILAAMIADPTAADSALLDAWVNDLDNYMITDAVSGYAGRTALVCDKAEQWTERDEEWPGAAGWNLLSHLALQDMALPDGYFRPWLARIERDLHGAKNRVRYAMNNAVIAIGMRNEVLEAEAIAAAQRIGKVIVDHGETGCKTPDAAPYIVKARQRRAAPRPAPRRGAERENPSLTR